MVSGPEDIKSYTFAGFILTTANMNRSGHQWHKLAAPLIGEVEKGKEIGFNLWGEFLVYEIV